jgi:hypothetical protein
MSVETQGFRLAWEKVPDHVRGDVADRLGSAVVAAENQHGGFSPGVAARCQLADGRRCFIKAVSDVQNPDSPDMHRREGKISSLMPPGLPVPALIEMIDDGHWVVLIFEEIDGQPPGLPWSFSDLAATFAALESLSAVATPCPVPGLPTFAERYSQMFRGFRCLAGGGDPTVDLIDPWSRRHLDRLALLEAGWEPATVGDSLLHADLRADNLLIRPDGVSCRRGLAPRLRRRLLGRPCLHAAFSRARRRTLTSRDRTNPLPPGGRGPGRRQLCPCRSGRVLHLPGPPTRPAGASNRS